MFGDCECGHHKYNHPWLGRGPYGSASGYGGCNLCKICEKPHSAHAFVAHQFTPCSCSEYQETA